MSGDRPSPGALVELGPPPPITVEITPQSIVVELSHTDATPTGERGPTRFDLRAIADDDPHDPAEPLRTELARLRTRVDANADTDREANAQTTNEPRLGIRVADGVSTGDVQQILDRALRAGQWEFELEVASAAGVRRIPLLPYTFCACPMPESTSWCAAPELRIDEAGVTLIASPDLTPPAGCHKTIRGVGQENPPFHAEIDWRSRVIAGPDGGCPSASIAEHGIDMVALEERLTAVHRMAPGCGWAAIAVDHAVPWARVAEGLAAVHGTFGELRIAFNPATPTADYECASALPITKLAPAKKPKPPLARRPGCGEEPAP